jgi:hypothetical protein
VRRSLSTTVAAAVQAEGVESQARPPAAETQIAQGWPESCAKFRPLMGFSVKTLGRVAQFGPTL